MFLFSVAASMGRVCQVLPFARFVFSFVDRPFSCCVSYNSLSTGRSRGLGGGCPRMDVPPSPPPSLVALRYADTRPPGLAGIVLVNAFTSTPLPGLATRGLLAAQGPPEWMFRAQPPPEIVARALLGGGDPAAVDLARGMLVLHPPSPTPPPVLASPVFLLCGPSVQRLLAYCPTYCSFQAWPSQLLGVPIMVKGGRGHGSL